SHVPQRSVITPCDVTNAGSTRSIGLKKVSCVTPAKKEQVMDNRLNTMPRQSIPMKLYRTADRMVIAAPMAGVRAADVSIEVTGSGHLIVQSEPRAVLRTQLFDVVVTVDRDGDQEVWTREQWQESKEVVFDEWSTLGYYREVELPSAVDAALGTATYGN